MLTIYLVQLLIAIKIIHCQFNLLWAKAPLQIAKVIPSVKKFQNSNRLHISKHYMLKGRSYQRDCTQYTAFFAFGYQVLVMSSLIIPFMNLIEI